MGTEESTVKHVFFECPIFNDLGDFTKIMGHKYVTLCVLLIVQQAKMQKLCTPK